MSASFFLDTNVFAYEYAGVSPGKQAVANALIERALEDNVGVISFQVVQEFFSVAFRRFNPPMTPPEAEEYLAITLAQFRTIHSSYALYQSALELSRSYSLSWYDSLIVAAALEAECQILYTEDLQHGQKFGSLKVQNPFV
jgi:predicted nucleic acid-binding protein